MILWNINEQMFPHSGFFLQALGKFIHSTLVCYTTQIEMAHMITAKVIKVGKKRQQIYKMRTKLCANNVMC